MQPQLQRHNHNQAYCGLRHFMPYNILQSINAALGNETVLLLDRQISPEGAFP